MKSMQLNMNDRTPVVSVRKSGMMTKTFTLTIDNQVVMAKKWPIGENIGLWNDQPVRMTGRFLPGLPGRFLISVTVGGQSAEFTFIN